MRISSGLRLVLGGSLREAFRAGYQTALLAGGTATLAEVAAAYYRDTVGFRPDPRPGEALDSGRYYIDSENYRPPQGKAVFGANQKLAGDFWADFWKQGGFIGHVGNATPTGNAIAALHDVWTNGMAFTGNFNQFNNVGSMLPALVVTESALLAGPTAGIVLNRFTQDAER